MATDRNIVAIVDDDPVMRAALEALLPRFGYVAEPYASAEEFMRAAATTEAACLVSDVELGDTTGLDMGHQLAADGFKFPMVFMTGSTDIRYRRQAVDLACVAYLQKPFPAHQLRDAIGAAIGRIPRDEAVRSAGTD